MHWGGKSCSFYRSLQARLTHYWGSWLKNIFQLPHETWCSSTIKYSASSICFSESFEEPSRRDIAECLADERKVGSLRGLLGRIIHSAWASVELSTPRKGIFLSKGWKRCFPSWKCPKINCKFHRWALMDLYNLASHTFTTADQHRKKKLLNRNQLCIL
jgi:hypothetical protein